MKDFSRDYGGWIVVPHHRQGEEFFMTALGENRVWTIFRGEDPLSSKLVSGYHQHNNRSGYVISDEPYNRGDWIEYDW